MCHKVSEHGDKSIPRCDRKIWRLYIYVDNDTVVKLKESGRKEENNNTSNYQRINVMVKVFSRVYKMWWTIVNRLKEKS